MTRYIECDIVYGDGIVNRGMINTTYIIYAEKFDDLTLFHMKNGEGIYVKHDYDTVLAEMKKGWNASYDFVTLSREVKNGEQ